LLFRLQHQLIFFLLAGYFHRLATNISIIGGD
jgi:hypothetical protein